MIIIDPSNSRHERSMFRPGGEPAAAKPRAAPTSDRVRTVRDVLIARFHLEAVFRAPPSATGGQLQAMREGRSGGDDSADWRRALTSSARQVLYADALLLTRDLNDEQVEVCRLRYWCPLDGHEELLHHVREGELVKVRVGCVEARWRRVDATAKDVNMLDVLATPDGNEHVRMASDDGWAVVREVRARLTSFTTIAERLGCTTRQARTRLDEARQIVHQALLAAQEVEPR